MEQTAVEWFLSELERMQYFIGNDMLEAYKQAKEMEATQKSKLITDLTNSFFSNKGFKYNDEDNWADYCKNYTGTIKKSELRIGNWIQSENHNRQKVIIQVNDGFCIDFAQRNNGNPLPLTEEWLIKFGFEKPAHSWNGDIFHLTEWDEFPLNWAVAMDKNGAILVLKLKYVHQLQNLYFALTGVELEIKETTNN
jgi:hypothetical protein